MGNHDEIAMKFDEEHRSAVESMAAERYVLGEMEPAERDAFEDHFFDCVECSSDVRDETKFGAGVTVVSRIQPNHLKRWAVAAAAAVVITSGGAYFWQHQRSIGQSVPIAAEQPIELDASRGPDDVRKVRADQPVALYFVIPPPEQPLPLYTCELQDAAGGRVQMISVTSKQAESTVRMPLKAQTLRGGRYTVVIRGGDREIARYTFMVEVW